VEVVVTMTAPDVTIIVSSYEQAVTVGTAVRSALAQTYPCRVVAVDDGSADGSAEAARRAGVPVIELPHGGALAAFRAAADSVTTPFFLILAGDDALEPGYVEATVREMADPEVGFVYTGVRYVGALSGVRYAHPFDRRRLLRGNYAHGTSLVRTEAYRSVGGFDPAFERTLEDWALWVDMVAAGWKGAAVRAPLLRYTIHPDASRNARSLRSVYDVRWRLWRAHRRLYGLRGLAVLVASELLFPLRWASLRLRPRRP
jgi:glycosyltransferase involved in cell wall biosynthesis